MTILRNRIMNMVSEASKAYWKAIALLEKMKRMTGNV